MTRPGDPSLHLDSENEIDAQGSLSEEAKTITTILRHNRLVASYLINLACAMEKRAIVHDASKLSVDEFTGFVQINRIAREHEYGSQEYKDSIKKTDAVALHYSRNPHHPEHYKSGVDDMSLVDLIEMVADWKAASETYGQTSLEEALEIQAKRFGLSAKHLYLIGLIVKEFEKT